MPFIFQNNSSFSCTRREKPPVWSVPLASVSECTVLPAIYWLCIFFSSLKKRSLEVSPVHHEACGAASSGAGFATDCGTKQAVCCPLRSCWAASSPVGTSINWFPSTSGVICCSVQSCCAHRWTRAQCQGGDSGQVGMSRFCAVFCTSGDVRVSMSCSPWVHPNAMTLESPVCLALLL